MWTATTLCVILALAGCSSALVSSSQPLPDLRLPGVVKIPGIAALQERTGFHVITALITYADSKHETHVLFDSGPSNFDVRLDGSGLQPVQTQCASLHSLSPDGRFVACDDDTGIVLLDLMASGPNRDRQILEGEDGDYVASPTWAPDGRHLAVLTNQYGGCSMAFYTVSADYATFTLTALLSLAQFDVMGSNGPVCSIYGLTWSPDGAWMLFDRSPYPFSMFALHLAPLLPQLLAPHTSPVILTTPPNAITQVGMTADESWPIWSPTPEVVTYVDQLGWTIKQVNIRTGVQTTLLTQHVAGVRSLSWTPDGKHLVFVFGFDLIDENQPPPTEIYVYTPPGM